MGLPGTADATHETNRLTFLRVAHIDFCLVRSFENIKRRIRLPVFPQAPIHRYRYELRWRPTRRLSRWFNLRLSSKSCRTSLQGRPRSGHPAQNSGIGRGRATAGREVLQIGSVLEGPIRRYHCSRSGTCAFFPWLSSHLLKDWANSKAIQVENTLNSVESKELPLPEKKKRSRKPASKLATKAPEVQDEKLPNLKPGPRKRGRPAKTNAGKTSTLQGSNESPPKSVKPARGNDTDEAPTLDVPRRNSSVVKNDSESELSDLSDVPHKRSRKGQVKQAKEKDSDINAVIPTDKGPTNTDLVPAPVWDAAGNVSGAESEMSIVLDEPPEKKKKGRPRSSTGDSTAKKPAKKPAGPAKVRKQKESV
jgi:hypothetical protein